MDCRSDSEGKTDEGSGYDKRNIKDNPSSVATRQVPKGKPYKVGADALVPPPTKRNALLSRHLERSRDQGGSEHGRDETAFAQILARADSAPRVI